MDHENKTINQIFLIVRCLPVSRGRFQNPQAVQIRRVQIWVAWGDEVNGVDSNH